MHFILLFPLITVKISGQNTKSPTRRLSKVEERWQTDQGPWDMRSHTAMSTLGRGGGGGSFLLPVYPGLGALQTGNANEHRQKEHLQEKPAL